jgi:outer membrane receptor protein involved in Fe transport
MGDDIVMNAFVKSLLLGGSATALIAGAAYAQDNAADIETVNSSASRVDLKGFEAPTPVTVIGVDTLNRDAKVQIGDEIRELPQIRGGTSITTGSNVGNIVQINAGVDSVALRNLGTQRNLVLFDHQRVTPSSIQEGVVDLSLIPQGLVQRVDVVTGGASAAWGSDAVTGVINVVLNKTFEGFKGNVTYSDSTEVANPAYKISMAWGTSFLGGKGHLVAGADLTISNAEPFAGDEWRAHPINGRTFVYNQAYCNSVAYPAGKTTGGSCTSVNAGQPLLTYAFGVGSTTAIVGGLVQSNTVGATGSTVTANSLKGTMFVGPDATPTTFNYGTLQGTNQCYNGCTNNQFGTGGWGPSSNPYHSGNYLLYSSYQITPDIKASIQLNYGRLSERLAGGTIPGTNRVIAADNPYLPDSVAQAFVCQGGTNYNRTATNGGAGCVGTLSNGYNPYTHGYVAPTLAAGENALTVAQARPSQTLTTGFEFSGNRPNGSPSGTAINSAVDYSWNGMCNAVYRNCGWGNKAIMRGVFTLEGSLGDDWTWNAYIQNSEMRIKENVIQVVQQRVNNALDAVRITSGNVGTSGLPIGSIQCRALLNPSVLGSSVPAAAASGGITTASEVTGCVPFDPFGEASVGTMNYIKPGLNLRANGEDSYGHVLARMQQAAGEVAMQGVLPWQLPAGEVAVAFGADWRLERQGEYDIDTRAINGMYPSGNFGSTFEGHLHAEEGFLEVDAPLLKDLVVNDLAVSLAGRMTNYSFSGLVETWKIGFTSQVTDDVKLRFTWSYDIRQPDVYDLYAPGANSQQQCASFINGPGGSNAGNPNSCFNVNGGNQNLVPEKANTIAAGVVLTPTFLDGVTASIDWYQIHLHGALYTPGQTEPLTRCKAGETVYCSLLVFDRQGSFAEALGCGSQGKQAACPGGDTTSQVDFVFTQPVNASLLTTAGFDFAIAYGFDFLTGQMDVSFNGNYMYDFSRTLQGITFQGAGCTSGYYCGGQKFRGTLNLNYREGAWSFGTQVRIQGESIMDFGNEGQAGIPISAITSYTAVTVNGATQNVPTFSSGQRDPVIGASENYNAAVVTTDLRVQYRWNNNITLFGAVDNIQDLPTAGGFLRRSYRMGVRWNY